MTDKNKITNAAELNKDIHFCEECALRIRSRYNETKCAISHKTICFSDRTCQHFCEELPEQDVEEVEFDEELNAFVI